MIYRFGRFELNDARYELTRDGRPVDLEPRVLEVLAYLAAHRDRVVSKDELLGELWEGVVVSESALTRAIKKARSALDDPSWIKAIYGRGYTFEAEVAEIGGDPEAGPESAALDVRRPRRRFGRRAAVALALLALAVALLALWRSRNGEPPESATPERRVEALAVLPLRDLSPEGAEAYLASGLTEALIIRLAKVGDLRVIGHASVSRYREGDRPLRRIAEELRVGAVLDGSVLRVGDRLRVSARLVRVPDGEHLWAEEYERDAGDVLGLQAEIAEAVVDSVRSRLPSAERSRLSGWASVDPEAYRRYLLGRFHAARRTVPDLEESVRHLRKALRLDPRLAPAHAALADAYCLLTTYYGMEPEEAFARAESSARRAVELDPDLAEAHAALGWVAMLRDWDFATAEARYRRALELAPGSAPTRQRLAELLSVLGRHQEAVAEGRWAWDLDPLSAIVNAALGQRLSAAGRWREALDQFAATLDLDPGFAWIHRERAYALTHLGEAERAVAERLREMEVRGIARSRLDDLRAAVAADGMSGFWRWELDRLERRSRAAYVPALLLAEGHEGIADRDGALVWLDRALAEKGDHALQLTTSPELRALLRDGRIAARLREAGLGHLTVGSPGTPEVENATRSPEAEGDLAHAPGDSVDVGEDGGVAAVGEVALEGSAADVGTEAALAELEGA